MKWTDELDGNRTNHALLLDPGEPLEGAFVEFWKRVLSDGVEIADTSHWQSLSFDIAERQVEADEQGYMRAVFHNGTQRQCSAEYFLRSEAFTLLQPKGEDNKAFNKRQIRWFLGQYTTLKQATAKPEVRELLSKIDRIRPLPISAGTAYGWFDLGIGKPSFGRLPSEDRAMLEGRDPGPANPLKDLMAGIIDFD